MKEGTGWPESTPVDLLDEVARAWDGARFDVDDCFTKAASVTGDGKYTPVETNGVDPCVNVRTRLSPVIVEARRVPLKLKKLSQILNPQLETAQVLHDLLSRIDR